MPTGLTERVPRLHLILVAAIPLLTLAAYVPAMRAGYIWDDDDYVVNNKLLRTSDGLDDVWFRPTLSPQYYPLVFTTFWVEHQLWGLNPAGYHVVNVLLHATSAVLLYVLLRKLAINPAVAAVVAAVFAVHPVHVESVAWVTERKNVLSALFYLLSFLAFLRFWPADAERPKPRWGAYAASLVLFVCALLSKTVTCTLPAAILLVAWWKRGRLTWREPLALAPMFLLGLGAGLMTAKLEASHVGASGAEWSLGPAGRLVLAGRVAAFYVLKDAWPHPLIFFYPRWNVDPASAVQWVPAVLVAGGLVALLLFRKRIGRGPVVLLALYLATLFPAMGFFNVYPMRYSYVADHFQYLASIPVLIALIVGAAALLRKAPAWAGVAIVPVLLATLGVLTFRQCHAYADVATLWRDTIAKNPGAWAAWHNLGLALAARGDHEQAMNCYERVISLKPDHAECRLSMATSLEALHRDAEADAYYDEALRIRPNYASVWVARSTRAGQRGDNALAERYARKALELDPTSMPARINLASAMGATGRPGEAAVLLREVLDVDPWAADARALLAVQLFNTNNRVDALSEAHEAVRRDPQSTVAANALAMLERANAKMPR